MGGLHWVLDCVVCSLLGLGLPPTAAALPPAPLACTAAGSVGFTRRAGAGRLVHASLQQLLRRFPGAVPAAVPGGESGAGGAAPIAALVFGREESGLLEAELQLCSHACAIPTGAGGPGPAAWPTVVPGALWRAPAPLLPALLLQCCTA